MYSWLPGIHFYRPEWPQIYSEPPASGFRLLELQPQEKDPRKDEAELDILEVENPRSL